MTACFYIHAALAIAFALLLAVDDERHWLVTLWAWACLLVNAGAATVYGLDILGGAQ